MNSAENRLLGKNVNDLIKKGYFSENGAVSLKCIETGLEESMIQKGRDDGQEITVTGVPLIEHGKVKFVVVTERDVSEINRLEKELRKNQQLVKEYSQQLEQYRKDARGGTWKHNIRQRRDGKDHSAVGKRS